MTLPWQYHAIYQDSPNQLKYADQVFMDIYNTIIQIRDILEGLAQIFDFHGYFLFARYMEMQQQTRGQFTLHIPYPQAQDFNANEQQPPRLSFNLNLLSIIKANAFIGFFCEIFQHSMKFSNIQELDLRGCEEEVVSK